MTILNIPSGRGPREEILCLLCICLCIVENYCSRALQSNSVNLWVICDVSAILKQSVSTAAQPSITVTW